VVNIDLEKFFDRVSHILMGLVARRIADKRGLMLIRSFLESGVMINGVCHGTEEREAARRPAVALHSQT
jgi:retron-type reverse transcriptase